MKALWRGAIPLSRAFWEFTVLYGALASLASTAASIGAIVAGLPGVVAAVLHFLPTPYLVVAAVGVWRSADAYGGPPTWALLARIAAVFWAILMIIL